MPSSAIWVQQEDRHAQRALRQLPANQQEAEPRGEQKDRKQAFLYDMVRCPQQHGLGVATLALP
jgi:hypothetical protein